MKQNEYNAIGIESQLDWPRIKKLMTIGLVAACLVFIGDWMLGVFGIFLEGLSYFGIYRLMAEKSSKHAHGLRTGIIGYIAFGACGVHVPCVMVAWLYNYLIKVSPDAAYKCCLKFATYFMIPSTVIFTIFCIYMVAVQISAFVKGMTPYPKWCFIFNIGFGMIATMLIATPFRGYAWGNALAATWISVGNIWQFAGLLIVMKRLVKQ